MSLNNKKIALVTAAKFEESEVIFPYYRLKEEGAEVVFVSACPKGTLLKGKNGVKIPVDVSVNDLDFDSIHAVVVPGGFAPDFIRTNERVQALVHHVHSRGGVVAAICHGPWVLVSADLLEGRECTSVHTIKDDLENSRGKWQDSPVVIDNRIITSRLPEDLPEFCRAIIQQTSQLNF